MQLPTFKLDGISSFVPTSTPENENTSIGSIISSVSRLTDEEIENVPFISDDDAVFARNGYHKMGKICDTLQGELFQAMRIGSARDDPYVAIKRTGKDLWRDKIAMQEDITFCVTEDIVREASVLNYLTVKNQPIGGYVIQFIDFFESKHAFYLVIEYIDSMTNLKQFVSKCAYYIQTGKLCIKEYRQMIKFILWQLFVTVQWMHISMRCCHLDLCMENVMLTNLFVYGDGDTGSIHINRNITIKLCDFGVAEVFNDNTYLCRKQGLNVDNEGYYAPKVFNGDTYDARCADNWSLGMILFECITIGKKMWTPIRIENAYNALRNHQLKQYLHENQMLFHFSSDSFCLLRRLLCVDQRYRLIGIPILAHVWFHKYFNKYVPQIAKKFKKELERKKKSVISKGCSYHRYHHY